MLGGGTNKEYTADVLKTLYQQARNKKFTDFEIRAGNKRVACHRYVVRARSEYFDSICSSGLNEAVLDYASDEHGHLLEAIVKFMYLGKTDLTVHNVESMLLAADFIKHADLKRYCEEFMLTNLTVANFTSCQEFAAKMHLSKLNEDCVRLSKRQFTSIVQTDWFTSLSVDLVRDYLQDEELVVENEDDVMHAINRWLQSTKASTSLKEGYADDLFPCVRLRFCRQTTLHSLSTDRALMSCVRLKILEYLQHGLYGDCKPRKSYASTAVATEPTTDLTEHVLIVGGLKTNGEIHRNIVLLDQDPESSILTQPPLCAHSSTSAACATENGLIMSGGYDTATRSTMKTVQLFNISDRSWWNLPDLPQPLLYHCSAYVNSAYYTIGGRSQGNNDNDQFHAAVMKLDLRTMAWGVCQSLPLAVSSPGVAVVESDIFVLSGHTGTVGTNHVSRYNTQTGRRTGCAHMPDEAAFYQSTVAVNRLVFVLSLQCLLQYDTTSDQWTKLPPPIKPSRFAAMVHKQGRLLVLGGYKDTWVLPNNRVQTYDLAKQTWVA